MPHSTAKISESGSKYMVTTGPRNNANSYYDSFEDAYRKACEWVNWSLYHLTIDILPVELREAVDTVTREHDFDVLEGKVATTFTEYSRARDEYDVAKIAKESGTETEIKTE